MMPSKKLLMNLHKEYPAYSTERINRIAWGIWRKEGKK